MKKLCLWLWLLTKRLYKRPTFLTILVLIPVLVLGYSLATRGDSGMVTIALSGESDPVTTQVMEQLEQSGQLLRYIRCDSAEAAEELVRTGKAEGAWIFPEDLEAKLTAFSRTPTEPVVRVVQREETVMLMLARERLSGALYPYIARAYYLDFIRSTYPELSHLTNGEVLAYYDGTDMDGTLFEYDAVAGQPVGQVHYLLSPVRGLLAILTVLGGMAAAMYWERDRQTGTFRWLPERYHILPELGSQLVTALNLGLASVAALALTGTAQTLPAELPAMLVYAFAVSGFCMLLRRLLGSIAGMGIAMPLLVVAMLLLCPVFFEPGAGRWISHLLPPTYYIQGSYDGVYLLYGIFFAVTTWLCCLLTDRIFGRKGFRPLKKPV